MRWGVPKQKRHCAAYGGISHQVIIVQKHKDFVIDVGQVIYQHRTIVCAGHRDHEGGFCRSLSKFAAEHRADLGDLVARRPDPVEPRNQRGIEHGRDGEHRRRWALARPEPAGELVLRLWQEAEALLPAG